MARIQLQSSLKTAIAAQTWDDSIKGLVHYPTVLKMMSDQIDWTQTVGAAFLDQQKDVLASVQRSRSFAQAAKNLQTTQQEQIVTDGDAIRIEPVDTQHNLRPPVRPQTKSITTQAPSPTASASPSAYGTTTISTGDFKAS